MTRWQVAPTAAVSAIPLIDVLLVLLVACIPLLAGDRLGSLPMDIPAVDASSSAQQRWVLSLDQTGALSFEGHQLSRATELTSRVPADAPLELAAHPALATETLAKTLRDLQLAGFVRVSLITKPQ